MSEIIEQVKGSKKNAHFLHKINVIVDDEKLNAYDYFFKQIEDLLDFQGTGIRPIWECSIDMIMAPMLVLYVSDFWHKTANKDIKEARDYISAVKKLADKFDDEKLLELAKEKEDLYGNLDEREYFHSPHFVSNEVWRNRFKLYNMLKGLFYFPDNVPMIYYFTELVAMVNKPEHNICGWQDTDDTRKVYFYEWKNSEKVFHYMNKSKSFTTRFIRFTENELEEYHGACPSLDIYSDGDKRGIARCMEHFCIRRSATYSRFDLKIKDKKSREDLENEFGFK